MPALITRPDKTCKKCGASFNRRIGKTGLREAIEDFDARLFCSSECFHLSCTKHILNLANLSDTQLAYLAGIFDGEGSVFLRRQFSQGGRQRTYSLSVTVVVGTHYEAVKEIAALVGSKPTEKINDYGNKRPAWRVRLHGRQAREYLLAVRPYLLMKDKQADLAIEFQNAKLFRGQRCSIEREEAEERAKIELTKLNARGVKLCAAP